MSAFDDCLALVNRLGGPAAGYRDRVDNTCPFFYSGFSEEMLAASRLYSSRLVDFRDARVGVHRILWRLERVRRTMFADDPGVWKLSPRWLQVLFGKEKATE